MAKKEFKTLEEALAHIDTLNADIEAKSTEIQGLKKAVKDAEAIAEHAVNQANEEAAKVPGQVTAKVAKETYIVRFGVDGLTKAELAKDEAKIKELIKIGSGALVKKEA